MQLASAGGKTVIANQPMIANQPSSSMAKKWPKQGCKIRMCLFAHPFARATVIEFVGWFAE